MSASSRFGALLLASCLGAMGACGPGDDATGEARASMALSGADKGQIRATDSAFAASINAGDVEGVAAVYAEDAVLLAPNLPPQKGRQAVRAFWKGFLDAYTPKFEVVSDTIEGRHDLAYNMGHYRFSAVPKAKGVPGVTDEGKFLVIVTKQPGGEWKVLYDMYSSNLALEH